MILGALADRVRPHFLPLAASLGLILAGCAGPRAGRQETSRPADTDIASKGVSLPGQIIGNLLIIETKGDAADPYHFLVDTGSSATLISPELAQRLSVSDAPSDTGGVQVQSADEGSAVLLTTVLKRLQLGGARFDRVPALVYDCSDLSAQLGVRIDGILGFSVFRNTVFTLDYPRARLVLRRSSKPGEAPEDLPGVTVPFVRDSRAPVIAAQIGSSTVDLLLDSGDDGALSLNPGNTRAHFDYGPVDGPTVGTLAGDRAMQVGRLADDVVLGGSLFARPVASTTHRQSSVGSALLKSFSVTFDPEHDRVSFERADSSPILTPPLRSTGLSFRKTPAYWKVIGVVPKSPAEEAAIDQGDLIVRIEGEPVSQWGVDRYGALLASASSVEYTLLDGAREDARRVRVVNLVP